MSDVVEKITEEIMRNGVMPFARFMELALYCPDCGFYEKEKDKIGQAGDFFTSVSVGSLFGELLAFQFAEWFEESVVAGRAPEPSARAGGWQIESGASRRLGSAPYQEIRGKNATLRILEAGTHDGRLAADILRWLRKRRGEMFNQLEYCIIEPSPRRREWQEQTLGDLRPALRWLPEVSALKTLPSSRTIIFSNELLDAMPFHRLGWDAKAKKWFEWGVALDGGRFVWSRMADASNHGSRFTFHADELQKLEEILPNGFTTELNPAAETWWREAAGAVENGKLLTIDYGLAAEEFFTPERKDGTARAYYRHHATHNLLANPGEQDITAHVNFSAIQKAGEAAGLTTEIFTSQTQFLTRIAERAWKRADVFGGWDSNHSRQFQTLTHPEHLGRPFRVLVQSR